MEAYAAPPQQERAGSAGLVLLYAPRFADLWPAYPFPAGRPAIIGREPPATILVPQAAVSRAHARVVHDGEGWVLHDLGARNGTIVNGAFVHSVRLRHRDEIRIGDAFFKFVTHDAESYTHYRIDGAYRAEGAGPDAPAAPSGIVGGLQVARIALALERVARSPISVVLLGESGTGKEVFARQVHTWSARKGAFCALNCAAIPSTLLESQLFGYRRGAFSGADRDHVGLVRAADGGTLFLDEIGDMPLDAQAKLLRVLQTKEVHPLGATVPEQVDVRVVCATHRDLGAMQQAGAFRRDLFARLNEYSVHLPPLRERKEDVYALSSAFLHRYKRPDVVLGIPYLMGLLHYDYPYNVRELEALIKRGLALLQGNVLETQHLSDEVHAKMRLYGQRARAVPATPAEGGRPGQDPWHDPTWGGGDAPAEPIAPGIGSTSPAIVPPAPPASSPPPAPPETPRHDHDPHREAGVGGYGYVPSEEQLRAALARAGGNLAEVGRQFGRERMQVHRWLKRYGIDADEYR
ncbi:MAG: sigma 54-interacting transcriptional regulator [Myxococcales bacterium]|nr:sigma 54-interacting transcriptional regulator [Myxococcales bacterium]